MWGWHLGKICSQAEAELANETESGPGSSPEKHTFIVKDVPYFVGADNNEC